jgi:hypothetical protein
VGVALVLSGIVLMIIGTVMILRAVFRESVLWGLASILIPIMLLLFVVTHWSETKRGVLLQIAGVALFHLGRAMTPAFSPS